MTDQAVTDPPELILGPAVRYVDTTSATIWVETSAPAEVSVLGRTAHTFTVWGHHFALVVLRDLPAGYDEAYDVRLDGEMVWPASDADNPASRIRTIDPDRTLTVAFGSCRVDRPHDGPWGMDHGEDDRAVGTDALRALSIACRRGDRTLPDLLLLLGDQMYADEGLAPAIRERQAHRRGSESEPVGEVADFEEYTWLYHDSWQDPDVRWLLSTVPSAMIFDDHDVRDDWNTSHAWREDIAAEPWWADRITGAYMSYWIYQHLGNLSPDEIDDEGILARLCAASDDGTDSNGAGVALQHFATTVEDDRDRYPWSFARDLGATRLVVVDSRAGRALGPNTRSMLDDKLWDRMESALRGDCTHLLVATSLPLLLEPALHDLESWDEAVCAGAWGQRAAQLGEKLRRAADLEHWAAFRDSFDRMVDRLAAVGSGQLGRAPSTVLVLSGDVHHSYLARASWPAEAGVTSAVAQVVCSPMRNGLPKTMVRTFQLLTRRPVEALARGLARSAGVRRPGLSWSTGGPGAPARGLVFGNALGTLELTGAVAELRIELAGGGDTNPHLRPELTHSLRGRT